MEAKFKQLHPQAQPPRHGRRGDAGLDLFAIEEIIIPPRERKKIPLGFAMEIPEEFVALVWDRGGMAAKNGIHTLAGVIDSNYRGEVQIVLYNTTDNAYTISAGDKVAQMLIQRHVSVEFKQVDELSETQRGGRAWLSSGK